MHENVDVERMLFMTKSFPDLSRPNFNSIHEVEVVRVSDEGTYLFIPSESPNRRDVIVVAVS
jgi:hypothetical protein